MKSKRIITEWIIVFLFLILVLPYLNVKISDNGEELYGFLRIQIIFVNPIVFISLVFSQIWRIKKSNGFTGKEILKSFIPFVKTKTKIN